MMRVYVQSLLQTLTLICLPIRFLVFESMFMIIIAKMTPKMRKRSERARILELFDFVCHVCCGS